MILHPGRLCACGCQLPAEGRSKYHNEKHQQAVARQKSREKNLGVCCAESGCTNARHANGKYCRTHCKHTGHGYASTRLREFSKEQKKDYKGVKKPQIGATIYDPGCDPYNVSEAQARKWIRSGDLAHGTKVKIGDEEILIK